jgi:hypothetical protein
MRVELIVFFGFVAFMIFLIRPTPYCRDIGVGGDAEVYSLLNPEQIESEKQLIQNNEFIYYATNGTSMHPSIKANQICGCTESTYEEGDIVIFFREIDENLFKPIAHRIITISGQEITTKGDNNELADSPIKQENILCEIPEVPKYKTYDIPQ